MLQSLQNPVELLYTLLPLWLSLTVHEWAHARAAWHLGDDTAALMGRLTLNPLAHIDPIGTLLLPLLGVPFGWAKPVPVNPYRFRNRVSMRTGMMLTALAGPVSNLALAAFGLVLFAAMCFFHHALSEHALRATNHLLTMMIFLNIALALFNMIPIQPLDGSRVADALMPSALRPAWDGFCRLGPFALMAVILLPRMGGFSLFAWPMQIVQKFLVTIVHTCCR